jgi:hypothetical protein
MTKAEWHTLYNGFDTQSLLDAVDAIDELRDHLNDGEHNRPPEIRTNLLKLHTRAMDVVNSGHLEKAEAMFDMADDLDLQVFQMLTLLEKVEETLSLLLKFRPELVDGD